MTKLLQRMPFISRLRPLVIFWHEHIARPDFGASFGATRRSGSVGMFSLKIICEKRPPFFSCQKHPKAFSYELFGMKKIISGESIPNLSRSSGTSGSCRSRSWIREALLMKMVLLTIARAIVWVADVDSVSHVKELECLPEEKAYSKQREPR